MQGQAGFPHFGAFARRGPRLDGECLQGWEPRAGSQVAYQIANAIVL